MTCGAWEVPYSSPRSVISVCVGAGCLRSLHEQGDAKRVLARPMARDARCLGAGGDVDADRRGCPEHAGDVGWVEATGEHDRNLSRDSLDAEYAAHLQEALLAHDAGLPVFLGNPRWSEHDLAEAARQIPRGTIVKGHAPEPRGLGTCDWPKNWRTRVMIPTGGTGGKVKFVIHSIVPPRLAVSPILTVNLKILRLFFIYRYFIDPAVIVLILENVFIDSTGQKSKDFSGSIATHSNTQKFHKYNA